MANKYWHDAEERRIPNTNVDNFLRDLFLLYKKHGMSIGHEDGHGSFIINEDCEYNREWISYTSVDIGEP